MSLDSKPTPLPAHLLRDLVKLGWPVFIAQIAVMANGLIDTIMAGRYGTVDLAGVGIGNAIFFSVFGPLMGMQIAMTPIAARLYGAGRFADIGEKVRQGMWFSLVLAVVAFAVFRHPEPFLDLTQAAPEVRTRVRDYLGYIAWGIPPALLFRLFYSYSTAVSRPRMVMVFNLVGLAFKVPLNWVFMYGNLGAPELGALATLGVVAVPVYARPRIAVLSSGDEIVAPDRTPAPAQIRDSNRYAIAASLRAMGAEPVHGPTVSDEPGALEAALREALATCDGAMLSGGSSVGERDLTPGAIAALGPAGVVVHGLRIKPGKPTVLGASGAKPVIGLPGNPVSALIVLEAIVAPIIARLAGAVAAVETIDAILAAPLRGRPGWTNFIPVALEDEGTHLAAHPLALHSSLVSLPARASGYCEVGEDDAPLEAGTRVTVRRFLSGGLR